jgi:DNA polymerase
MPLALAKKTDRSAADFIDPDASLTKLRAVSKGCTGCDLYKNATQTVFGEGPQNAVLMMIGEQPGDSEDKEGHPFVGPAGRLLDKALAEAGIERKRVYVTNVVKHFKFIVRGKRRLHKKPTVIEIRACRPWLEAEIEKVKPQGILCLGATPAQALLGNAFRVTKDRGKPVPSNLAPMVMATVHPSSLLREPDPAAREENYKTFVGDLKKAAKSIK